MTRYKPLCRSGPRRCVQARRARGENLAAGLGDADAMLELRRERAVARHRGPAVVEHLHRIFAGVDHRLDREEHARLEFRAGAGARSEEHTSELQSLMRISYAVFCLKKKKKYRQR